MPALRMTGVMISSSSKTSSVGSIIVIFHSVIAFSQSHLAVSLARSADDDDGPATLTTLWRGRVHFAAIALFPRYTGSPRVAQIIAMYSFRGGNRYPLAPVIPSTRPPNPQ